MNNKKHKWSRYIPKFNHLGEPYRPTDKQLAFMMLPHVEAMYGGAAGGGKVIYDNSVILTPFGFKKGKDIKVGDRVNNPDGSIAKIIQVHPRNRYKVWRVFFNDGTFTDVAEQHLWLAWKAGDSRKILNEATGGESSAEVIETKTLKEWCDKAKQDEADGKRFYYPLIPVCKEQRFNLTNKYPSTINPYFLGLWLGDGSGDSKAKTVRFTSNDNTEMQTFFDMEGYEYTWDTEDDYRFKGKTLVFLREQLLKLKLLTCMSDTKFIPKQFLYGSLETRYAILQGLMDTDGTVDKRGHLSFTSTSQQLAEDVKTLVQSLGGTAVITEKNPFYKDGNGNRIYCKVAYTLYIKHREPWKLFRLKRKIDRCESVSQTMYRKVVDVRILTTEKTGRCITVSHPNGLYMTNDFIVTHNSDVLLMSALQYVDNPKYAGIIFRRALTDAELSGAIYARAKSWFAPYLESGEIRHVPRDNKFIFPSGAELSFGYLKNEMDHERYRSAEFQFIGFDELTTFEEFQYLFLFSRLRRLDGSTIPLRVRSGTNPSGIGLQWVKRRWRIMFKDGHWQGLHPHRKFIQAFVKDNEFIDESYQFSLHQLDPVSRAQMAEGDWSCGEDSLFKEYYFSDRYTIRGSYFSALESRHTWHRNVVEIFFTVDPAGTQRNLPQGINIHKNKGPAWSVVCVWAKTSDGHLLLLDMIRKQCTIPDLLQRLMQAAKVYKPTRIIAERNGLGLGVTQVASWMGLPIDELHTSVDKVKNASNALFRASKKKIILPDDAPWLDDFEEEVFTWMGTPNETDDIIDNVSNAANYVQQCVGGQEREYFSEADESPITQGGWNNGIINEYSSY